MLYIGTFASNFHLLDDCLVNASDGSRTPLEQANVKDPALRKAVAAALDEKKRRTEHFLGLVAIQRICSALRGARTPLLASEASAERVARMQRLMMRGVMPSLKRRPVNTLGLLLAIMSQSNIAKLSPAQDEVVPFDEDAAAKLSLIVSCFADLIISRCMPMTTASVYLAHGLKLNCNLSMIVLQRLLCERSVLLSTPNWTVTSDPFDHYVA